MEAQAYEPPNVGGCGAIVHRLFSFRCIFPQRFLGERPSQQPTKARGASHLFKQLRTAIDRGDVSVERRFLNCRGTETR